MTPQQTNSKQGIRWLWLPVIIGLILGVAVAAMTDQWWWATVGTLAGAAYAAVSAGRVRWPGSTR